MKNYLWYLVILYWELCKAVQVPPPVVHRALQTPVRATPCFLFAAGRRASWRSACEIARHLKTIKLIAELLDFP